MKRIFVFLIAATLSCLSMTSRAASKDSGHWQDKRSTLQISAGYISGFWAAKQLVAWIPAAAGHSREWKFYGNYGLQYYYQTNWWCRVGVKAVYELDGYKLYTSKKEDGVMKGFCTNHTFTLMPSVQFTYLNLPFVQLYSGLDVGASAYLRHTRYEPGYSGEENNLVWLFALNITPIGVSFGSWPVYGFVETNLGYDAVVKAGLGVHF